MLKKVEGVNYVGWVGGWLFVRVLEVPKFCLSLYFVLI